MNSEILIGLEGGITLAAIVTNDSANDLGLDVGADAVAIFKASSVILGVLD
ncbi:molybdenum-pterin binding domain protein [compost metagenome]